MEFEYLLVFPLSIYPYIHTNMSFNEKYMFHPELQYRIVNYYSQYAGAIFYVDQKF